MDNQESPLKSQRVALPTYLPQRMVAFRIGSGAQQSYVVRDKIQQKTYDFEPWQFFVLEVLPTCPDREKLASVFEDRFGYDLPQGSEEELFASLADANLFSDSALEHPLLRPYANKEYLEQDGRPRLKSFRALISDDRAGRPTGRKEEPPQEAGDVVELPPGQKRERRGTARNEKSDELGTDSVLPAGIQDALEYDPRRTRRLYLAFDPRPLLRVLVPVLAPLRFLTLGFPLLFAAALVTAFRQAPLLMSDLAELSARLGFLERAAFSLFTVNLVLTLTSAVVAHRYRATVQSFGIALFLRFLPRFALRLSHLTQLNRTERMWLHGAPLLVRGGLLSVGVLAWRMAREPNPLLAQWALAFSAICFLGLLIAANPLLKGSGYQLLAAFSNEPQLRGKALKALYSKWNGKSFKESEDLLLSTYALSTIGFSFALIVAAVLILGQALHQLKLGGSAFFVMGALGVVLTRRMVLYLRQVQESYERAEQFERWRRRALPADPAQAEGTRDKAPFATYLWRAVPVCMLGVMFLPYPYSPGGKFTVSPALQQVVSTDVSGIVKVVHVKGGEILEKGSLIAELDASESQAQADVLTAAMNEQRAVIEDLESRPRRSDIALSEQALAVSETRAKFAKSQMVRLEDLYQKGVIPAEEWEEGVGDYEVSVSQVAERRAAVQVAKEGPSPEQIAAAEAKWESLKAERGTYLNRIERSRLRMPFDGRLLTSNLKERGNAYYEKGEPFAAAEVVGPVTAEIEVPESDMEFVAVGDSVRIRPKSRSERTYVGQVETIDWKVTERQFGNVVKVMAVIQGADELRNGMSGYAKIDGAELPVWKVFSLALVRFFQVEVWSWIP